MTTGIIFDIKRFSIHDGPGIRTTAFLKGCPLACQWCHNPESQSFQPELIFRPDRCLVCGECVIACPTGSIRMEEGRILQDRDTCQVCGDCVSVCYPGARELIGYSTTPTALVEELARDRVFYEESGGGVTFSGGEPLAQPDFLEECLSLCRDAGLRTALDTCGAAPWEELERQLPYLDLVLYDLKLFDDDLHQDYTGFSNQGILENFQRLVETGVEVRVRRPVIPGVNDSREEIEKLGEYLANYIGKIGIDLLPYHGLSADKYLRLGREEGSWESPSQEVQQRITTQLEVIGFEVCWGG